MHIDSNLLLRFLSMINDHSKVQYFPIYSVIQDCSFLQLVVSETLHFNELKVICHFLAWPLYRERILLEKCVSCVPYTIEESIISLREVINVNCKWYYTFNFARLSVWIHSWSSVVPLMPEYLSMQYATPLTMLTLYSMMNNTQWTRWSNTWEKDLCRNISQQHGYDAKTITFRGIGCVKFGLLGLKQESDTLFSLATVSS